MRTGNYSVVVAAGRGVRMGAAVNKVLLPLCGEPVIRHAVRAFCEADEIDGVVVVASADETEQMRAALCGLEKVCAIVPGGSTRQESVKNGLDALPKEARIALVHDGARPLISRELIARCIRQTEDCGSAVVCTPVTDTVKVEKDGCVVRTLDRSQLRAVQTPQCFFAGELKAAYEAAARDGVSVTDDASVMEHAGHSVHLLESSEVNFKLTTPEDLRRAEDIIGERKFMQRLPRTGFGYDVHKLVSGRRLILCGKEIPWEKGLDGHSDADVAVHALMDALLGAACLGDIGRLYPDNDPAFEGADSMKLLADVLRRVKDAGYAVVHADVTIVAQKPKLMPYMDEMRRNLENRICRGIDDPLPRPHLLVAVISYDLGARIRAIHQDAPASRLGKGVQHLLREAVWIDRQRLG